MPALAHFIIRTLARPLLSYGHREKVFVSSFLPLKALQRDARLHGSPVGVRLC